jgi:hypothetical protein
MSHPTTFSDIRIPEIKDDHVSMRDSTNVFFGQHSSSSKDLVISSSMKKGGSKLLTRQVNQMLKCNDGKIPSASRDLLQTRRSGVAIKSHSTGKA